MAAKIRRDDEVVVLAGKDKGKRGKVLLEEHYSKGKKEGVFIKYSAKGKLLSKYQYSADKKTRTVY